MKKIIHIPGLSKELEDHLNTELAKSYAEIEAHAKMVKPLISKNLAYIMDAATST